MSREKGKYLNCKAPRIEFDLHAGKYYHSCHDVKCFGSKPSIENRIVSLEEIRRMFDQKRTVSRFECLENDRKEQTIEKLGQLIDKTEKGNQLLAESVKSLEGVHKSLQTMVESQSNLMKKLIESVNEGNNQMKLINDQTQKTMDDNSLELAMRGRQLDPLSQELAKCSLLSSVQAKPGDPNPDTKEVVA